jgi:hypothetical protein
VIAAAAMRAPPTLRPEDAFQFRKGGCFIVKMGLSKTLMAGSDLRANYTRATGV